MKIRHYLVMALLILTGCATVSPKIEKEKTTIPLDSPRYLRYIVQRGDTFWGIAKMAYNDSGKWEKIFNANRDKVKDVRGLTPGEIIIIPINGIR